MKNTSVPTTQMEQMLTFCHLFQTIPLWEETEPSRRHLSLPRPLPPPSPAGVTVSRPVGSVLSPHACVSTNTVSPCLGSFAVGTEVLTPSVSLHLRLLGHLATWTPMAAAFAPSLLPPSSASGPHLGFLVILLLGHAGPAWHFSFQQCGTGRTFRNTPGMHGARVGQQRKTGRGPLTSTSLALPEAAHGVPWARALPRPPPGPSPRPACRRPRRCDPHPCGSLAAHLVAVLWSLPPPPQHVRCPPCAPAGSRHVVKQGN